MSQFLSITCGACGFLYGASSKNSGCIDHPLCSKCAFTVVQAYSRVGVKTNICPQSNCTRRCTLPRPATNFDTDARSWLMPATEEDVSKVKKLMSGVVSRDRDFKVFQIVNPGLESVFSTCKNRFRRAALPDDVKQVFHGTTRQASGSIIANGFDTSFAGKAHGTAHGHGVYVGSKCTISDGYAKPDSFSNRCMFVCDALLGGPNNHKNVRGSFYVLKREQQVLPRFVVHY